MFHVSRPFFSERYIAMKSVPPVVVFHLRHSAMPNPKTIPPKSDVTNGSNWRRARSPGGMNDVMASVGMMSAKKLDRNMTTIDCIVRRRPMKRKPTQIGTALSTRLMGENGTVTAHPRESTACCPIRCSSMESPVTPAG